MQQPEPDSAPARAPTEHPPPQAQSCSRGTPSVRAPPGGWNKYCNYPTLRSGGGGGIDILRSRLRERVRFERFLHVAIFRPCTDGQWENCFLDGAQVHGKGGVAFAALKASLSRQWENCFLDGAQVHGKGDVTDSQVTWASVSWAPSQTARSRAPACLFFGLTAFKSSRR